MKNNIAKTITLVLFLSVTVFVSFASARNEISAASRFIGNKTYAFQYIQPSSPGEIQTISAVQAESKLNKNSKVPILMYHHIRNYNNPNDQAGQTLSVSPQKFSDQLDLLVKAGYTSVTFADVKEGDLPDKPLILTFDDGYSNFYEFVYPEIKKRQMKAVVYVIVNFIGRDGYLNWDQIKEMTESQIEIGSHTLSHINLAAASKEKSARELAASKETIENKIGQEVLSLCYPSGKYSNETISTAAESGYAYAVTTERGSADLGTPLELKRYRINRDTSISPLLKQ